MVKKLNQEIERINAKPPFDILIARNDSSIIIHSNNSIIFIAILKSIIFPVQI
jgi:hypothetical protein